MKITRIELQNFKGRTGDRNLTKSVTVFTGPNDSGKTTYLDAIRTVLNGGTHPDARKAGKGIGETADWLSGAEARVQLLISDGAEHASLVCSYACTAGNWKMVSPLHANPVALMKSANDFFAMTGPEQTRYIFGLMPGGAIESFVAKLSAVADDVQPRTDKTDLTVTDWMVTAKVTEEARGIKSFNEWLLEYLASIKKRENEVAASVKRFQGFAQTTVQMRSRDAELSNDLPLVVEQIESAVAKVAALNTEIGGLEADVRRINTQASAIEAARQFVGDNPPELLDERKVELEKQIDEANRRIGLFKNRVPDTQKHMNDRQVEMRSAAKDVTDIKARISDLELERDGVLKQDCCPSCKSKAKGWKATAETYYAEEIGNARTALQNAEAKAVQRRSELTAADAANLEALAEFNEMDQIRDNRNKWDRELVQVVADIAKHKDAQALIDTVVAAGSAEELEAKIGGLKEQREVLNELLRIKNTTKASINEERGRITQGLKVEAEREEAEDEQRALKAMIKLVTTHQEAAVEQSLKQLLTCVNRVTSGIIPEPIAFKDGEIGRWVMAGRAKQWVTHRAFGGTYQAVAYIGLATAIAAGGAFKLVLMDELGRVDAANKPKLIQRMVELADEGVIHQFVGADVQTAEYPGAQTVVAG